MYSFIEGEIIEKHEQSVVVKPDGVGIGFLVNTPSRTVAELPPVGGSVRLYTSFLVKEDSHALFGFETPAERDLFEALLKTSGVGGRTALAILNLPRDRIVAAIAAGDSDVLRTVPGVGPKIAGRLVLELKERFAQELMQEWADSRAASEKIGPIPTEMISGGDFSEAVEALIELGYSPHEAREKVRHARASLGDNASAENLVRFCLLHP